MTSAWQRRLSWTGLLLAPAAWAISLQANYALVTVICDDGALIASAITAFLFLVGLVAGALSLLVARTSVQAEWAASSGGLPRRMVAWIGVGSGVLFALATANQFAATLIVNGCLA